MKGRKRVLSEKLVPVLVLGATLWTSAQLTSSLGHSCFQLGRPAGILLLRTVWLPPHPLPS